MTYQQNKKDILNETVFIKGKIIENLKMGHQEWVTIKLENNQNITINKKFIYNEKINTISSDHIK